MLAGLRALRFQLMPFGQTAAHKGLDFLFVRLLDWTAAAGDELPDELGDVALSVENEFGKRFTVQNPGNVAGLRDDLVPSAVNELRILPALRLSFRARRAPSRECFASRRSGVT